MAPASVTRTSSIAMLRSGACRLLISASAPAQPAPALPVALRRAYARARRILHPLGRRDADKIEAAGDHDLRRTDEREPERALLALEHAVLVVEAMEVVGDPDRVGRQG